MCAVAAALASCPSLHAEKKSEHGEEKDRQAQEGALLSLVTSVNSRPEVQTGRRRPVRLADV